MIVKTHQRTVWLDTKGRYVKKGEGTATVREFVSSVQPCVKCLPVFVAAKRVESGKALCEGCQ